MRGRFKSYSSIPQAQPKRVYICDKCGEYHIGSKPAQCHCGWLAFTHFPSKAEAFRWSALKFQESQGLISDLQRQVRFPLFAYGPDGEPVLVTHYQADFVYRRDGERIIEDEKALKGMLPEAKIRINWMAAQGTPVTTHSR